MLTVPGYDGLTKIHEKPNSLVYRAVRIADNLPVILKVMEPDNRSALLTERFEQDFNISGSMDTGYVVKPYKLEKLPDKWVMVMEDFGGESVKKLTAAKPFSPGDALSLAVKAAAALEDIHHHNIIHKDIKPSNFIFNPETGVLKITDFGISTTAHQEAVVIKGGKAAEGSFAYMAPEQTGRMNRAVDYRADLYSLGVTLYEWFTHKLPFEMDDPLELAHCHLAKQAPPPHAVNPGIPVQVSNIIVKLTAKSPEDRYQSARGLRLDLEECRRRLEEFGRVETFPLGGFDVSETFRISDKLYGREAQVKQLLEACERSRNGAVAAVMITGAAGVGKSALVNEINKHQCSHKGSFLYGKFDQMTRDIVYSAIGQAFQGLVMELLGESEEQLRNWKERMQQSWGPNGRLITDIIPDLELIVGKQPEPAELGPHESRNRHTTVLRDFFRIFAAAEYPLVLFLDDLQWADTASLALVELLLTDPEMGFLLLVGAYRDSEAGERHPLTVTLKTLQETKGRPDEIGLEPLGEAFLENMIMDTCPAAPAKVKRLADIIFHKTGGNPFFIKKLLISLNLDGLIVYSAQTGQWDWDENKLKEIRISENVLDFTIELLGKLPAGAKEVLKWGACVGNRFDAETLARAGDLSREELDHNLAAAVRTDILFAEKTVYPGTNNQFVTTFQFQHDRLQEAAYTMIPLDRRKEMHLRLGRFWLEHGSDEKIADTLFDIAWQFNEAGPLVTDKSEKINIAKLYLKAAGKAKESTAFANAVNYLDHAAEILDHDSWETHHDLTWEIYHQKAECEFSSTMLNECEKTIETALANSFTTEEKVIIQRIHLRVLFQFSRHYDALRVIRDMLALLGVSLPKKVKKRHVTLQFIKFFLRLGKRKPTDLMKLPQITDKQSLNICAFIYDSIPSTYMVAPDLMAYISMIMANICIRRGNSIYAPFAYAMASMVIVGVTRQLKTAYDFSMMAVELNKQYPDLDVKARVHFQAGFFTVHWVKPVEEYRPLWEIAFKTTLEVGNIHWRNYCITFSRPQDILFKNTHLSEMEDENLDYLDMHVRSKDREVTLNQHFILRFIRWLRGAESPLQHDPDDFDEERYAEEMAAPGNYIMRMYYFTFNLVKSFTLEDYDRALRFARSGNKIVVEVLGNLSDFVLRFYYLLTVQALRPRLSLPQRLKLAVPYRINKHLVKRAAEHCPENFRAQYYLVLAEEARVRRDDSAAAVYYEMAVRESRGGGIPRVTALCCELAGRYYLERGIFSVGRVYMTAAHAYYDKWGAYVKTKQLEKKYPRFFPRTVTAAADSRSGAESLFDLASVMKASQALSSEINLEKLLSRLLNIIVENAGAQKGVLVLENPDGPTVEGVIDATVNKTDVLQAVPLQGCGAAPETIVRFVKRTGKPLLIEDASLAHDYSKDPYIIEKKPKSILCVPLKRQDRTEGVLYLENTLTGGAFGEERGRMLEALLTQAAISIENARLVGKLEQDIAERKRTEEALRVSEEKLRRAQKLEGIGLLAGGIAHDFNNILTAINGYAEMALMKVDENSRAVKEIKQVLGSGKKAENLVRQLLAFSRKQVMMPLVMDVNLTLYDLQKMLRRMIGEDINIEMILADDIPCIKADPAQLEQVVINLFVNARDAVNQKTHTAPGKKITLETSEVFLDEAYAETNVGAGVGPYILISVTDNGVGMDEHTKNQIFDPFFTTKDVGKGTGLGMSTVYGIVKQNKGSIHVHSEPGAGTTFKVFWPALDKDVTVPDRAGEPETVIGGTETILFVEDDPQVKNVSARSLRSYGYTVYEALNGVIALNLMKNKKLTVDLLVTDMVMPEMNGKELAEKFKEISPSTRVLFCSGYAEKLTAADGSIAEGVNYFPKPYTCQALAGKVREILDRGGGTAPFYS